MYSSPYMYPVQYVPMAYVPQYPPYWGYPQAMENRDPMQVESRAEKLGDQGKQPFVINIEEAAKRNRNFRTAIWTGNNL
ncbi:hypothetical protein GCM10028868_32310 [Virgibacillus kimchii]